MSATARTHKPSTSDWVKSVERSARARLADENAAAWYADQAEKGRQRLELEAARERGAG